MQVQPRFCDWEYLQGIFRGKSVAVVGSGPGVLQNPAGLVDSHDVVVRVNNYKLFKASGHRTDVYYSYFGNAIRKTASELVRDGVRLCMCKCPDAQFIESEWHRQNGKMNGVDFRWIYEARAAWWFCPTFIPSVEHFLDRFELLGKRVPTTGFAALLDVLALEPAHVYATGFDFFASGLHNVNERWKRANPEDPIGHDPAAERAWLHRRFRDFSLTMDPVMTAAVTGDGKMKKRAR